MTGLARSAISLRFGLIKAVGEILWRPSALQSGAKPSVPDRSRGGLRATHAIVVITNVVGDVIVHVREA